MINCVEIEKNDPGPSPETEIDNPYRYIFVTEEPVFHKFPKLPREVRDTIWDYAVDVDSTSEVVYSSPTFPNAPFLSKVCQESRVACLKRYSTFRHSDVSGLSIPVMRSFGLDFYAWINYERDVLQLSSRFCHLVSDLECRWDCISCLWQPCKGSLLPVKKVKNLVGIPWLEFGWAARSPQSSTGLIWLSRVLTTTHSGSWLNSLLVHGKQSSRSTQMWRIWK